MREQSISIQEGLQRDQYLLAATYIQFTTSHPLTDPNADRTQIDIPDNIGDESDPKRIIWEYFSSLNRHNALFVYGADSSQLDLEPEEVNNLLDWIDRKITLYKQKKKIAKKVPHDPLLECKVLISLCEMFYQFPEKDTYPYEYLIPKDLENLYPTPPETVHERCLRMVLRSLDLYLLRTTNIDSTNLQGFRAMLQSIRNDYRDQLVEMRPELF